MLVINKFMPPKNNPFSSVKKQLQESPRKKAREEEKALGVTQKLNAQGRYKPNAPNLQSILKRAKSSKKTDTPSEAKKLELSLDDRFEMFFTLYGPNDIETQYHHLISKFEDIKYISPKELKEFFTLYKDKRSADSKTRINQLWNEYKKREEIAKEIEENKALISMAEAMAPEGVQGEGVQGEEKRERTKHRGIGYTRKIISKTKEGEEDWEDPEYSKTTWKRVAGRMIPSKMSSSCQDDMRNAKWLNTFITETWIGGDTRDFLEFRLAYTADAKNMIRYNGEEFYTPSTNFYAILCDKTMKFSYDNNVMTIIFPNGKKIGVKVLYKAGTQLFLQEKQYFDLFMAYRQRRFRSRTQKPKSKNIRNIYISQVDDIRQYSEKEHETLNGIEWFKANDKFYKLLSNEWWEKSSQNGDITILYLDEYNSIEVRIAYLIKIKIPVTENVYPYLGKYKIQNKLIPVTENSYPYLRKYMENRSNKKAEIRAIENIIRGPVTETLKRSFIDKVQEIFDEIAPNVPLYKNTGTESFAAQLVEQFSTKNIREFIRDYANFAAFLTPTMRDIGSTVLVSKIKNGEYTPQQLQNLSDKDKLPEIYKLSANFPKVTVEFIEETIIREYYRIVQAQYDTLTGRDNPSLRRPTRPKHTLSTNTLINSITCDNAQDIIDKGYNQKDFTYYQDNGKSYCLVVADIIDSILSARDDKSVVVDLRGISRVLGETSIKQSIKLAEEFVRSFRDIYINQISARKREKGTKELAPGLLDIILENINELQKSAEGVQVEDPEEEKLDKYPCWYCAKITNDADSGLKTMIYSDKKLVEAHFCTTKCMANQDKWPKFRPVPTETEKAAKEREEQEKAAKKEAERKEVREKARQEKESQEKARQMKDIKESQKPQFTESEKLLMQASVTTQEELAKQKAKEKKAKEEKEAQAKKAREEKAAQAKKEKEERNKKIDEAMEIFLKSKSSEPKAVASKAAEPKAAASKAAASKGSGNLSRKTKEEKEAEKAAEAAEAADAEAFLELLRAENKKK